MDNKTQLQANNERIEALTEILKNKSAGGGSGGLDINGLLKQCEAGETLEAGDFVNVSAIENMTFSTSTSTHTNAIVDRTFEIEKDKYLYFYATISNSGMGAMLVYKENGKYLTKAVSGNIYASGSTIPNGGAVIYRLENNKFLILHGSGTYNYLYGTIVEFANDTISVLKTTQISSSGYSANGLSDVNKIDTNKYIVMGGYSNSYYANIIRFTINDDYTITADGEKTTTYKQRSNGVLIDNDTLMFCGGKMTSGSLEIYKYSISANGITDTLYKISGYLSYLTREPKLIKIDDDNIAFVYCVGSKTSGTLGIAQMWCRIYNISTNTFSSAVQVGDTGQISTIISKEQNIVKYLSLIDSRTCVLNTLLFENGQFVSNTTTTYSLAPFYFYYTNTSLGLCSFIDFGDDVFINSYIVSPINSGVYLYMLYKVAKASKITTSTDTISGVAKDSGNTGDLIEVFVPNV